MDTKVRLFGQYRYAKSFYTHQFLCVVYCLVIAKGYLHVELEMSVKMTAKICTCNLNDVLNLVQH